MFGQITLIKLNQIENEFQNNQNYLNAIEGKTNIECFNAVGK